MMIIRLSPQFSSAPRPVLVRDGDTLLADGEPVDSVNGVFIVTLPYLADPAPDAIAFPDDIIDPADGPVSLPG